MTGADSFSHQYQVPLPLSHESTGKEVYKGHDTAPIPYYQPPSSASHTEAHANQPYLPASEGVEPNDSYKLEKRVLGLRVNVLLLIVSGLLLVVIAALALITALLGNKIASIEQAIPSFTGDVAAASESPDDSQPTPSMGPTPTTAHQAITTHITVANYQYIGCYINDVDRILTPSSNRTENKTMTNQACADFCGLETKYFGTSDGRKCFCGDRIAERAMKGNEWNCNMQCEGRIGKFQEICGGRWFLGVWERVEQDS